MKLDELVADLDRRAEEADAITATAPVADVIRVVREQVAELELNRRPASRPDQLLPLEEAAERLAVTVRWLYDNRDRLPFVRKLSHRQLRVSERGLERWLAQR